MRYCLTLDLQDDQHKIEEYESWHRQVWPEIIDSIKKAGITSMEIYRVHTRLVMVMETTFDFSFEKKSIADASNLKVQEWEQLMWNYQQAIPGTKAGEKWVIMKKIFDLKE